MGTFMLLVDANIVTVALPEIATDLDTGLSGLQWVMDGYALALAALLLVTGALADRVGAKPVYLTGLAVFAVASLACALAGSGPMLVAARVLQGIGGAAMFATTLSLLHATYTGRDRGVAFGAWGAMAGAASGLGTVLGGVLTEWLSWPWIFLVNLPIAAVAIVLSAKVFPRSPRHPEHAVDVPGMAAFAVAATTIVFGIIRAGEHGWGDGQAGAALGIGAAALLGFGYIESRSAAPMFPLALLRNRTFAATLLGASGQMFAAFASAPLLALWLQQQLRLSPLHSGLAMLPMAVVAFLVAGVFGRRLHGLAPRWTIGAGLIVIDVGSGLLLLIDAGSSWTAMAPAFVVIGIGVGVNSPALVSVGMAAVPPHQSATAAGAVNTARQLGMALGIAVLGTVFGMATDDAAGMTPAEFVDGLRAACAVASAVGITFGLAAFVLFQRARQATTPPNPQAVLVPAD
ncbi:MFS transporter [Nocardia crassostreae]|uniref:MFS transporter n=1 Tax=Nocardia crassostreae TaxID=53428 RepID=UPI001FE02292|nr:MFS transporter [Nocardia crassostreae]